MKLNESTALIVDDEPTLLEVTSRWFEREGVRVLAAANGALALDVIASHPVDFIVTDIRMPQLDGIAFLRKVKERGVYTPSIVFISSGSDVLARDACDLGIEATFSKPVARPQLIAAAERILAAKDSLWRSPSRVGPGPILSATFGSLSSALGMGQIAFGKGGFCIESGSALPEGPVQLAIDFAADDRKLSGRGLVRWSAPQERRIGVEILYLDETSRDWVGRQTASNETLSFIPRTTSVPAREAAVFSSDTSHDLRNLLSVVIAYSEACQELLEPEDPVRNYVQQMRWCAEQASLLVKHMSAPPAPIGAPAVPDSETAISDQEAS